MLRLVAGAWSVVEYETDPAGRTVSGDAVGSGTYQLGETTNPWDVNGDGVVDIVDLVLVSQRFGQATTGREDVTGDGRVDIADLVLVALHFGERTRGAAASAVPARGSSADVTLTVEASDEVGQGGLREVTIHADGAALAGYEFRVSLDRSVLALARVEPGAILGADAFWTSPSVLETSAHFAAVRLDTATAAGDGSGIVARLFVRATDNAAPSELLARAVQLREVRLSDADGSLLSYHTITPPGASRTVLLPNFPNPFNPETWIPFSLAQESEVTIRIYGVRGGLVRTLRLGRVAPGSHVSPQQAAHWDGRNESGEQVASGLYLVELTAGSSRQIRRMTVLK